MARGQFARKKESHGGGLGPAQATFQALMAEARSQRHHRLVEKLENMSEPRPQRTSGARMHAQSLPNDLEGSLAPVAPRRRLTDLVLPKYVTTDVVDFIQEHAQLELLRSHGLEPRHKLLLVGPPGTGKTSLAEVIASELRLPFFVVRYDGLIASYLGETATRLRRLTDFVAEQPCVLFFDEFDTLGKERGDTNETGEIKRVVSSLLLQMDSLPSHCVVVCATNHPELLDRAVWRRFELRIDVPLPGEAEIRSWLRSLSRDYDAPRSLDRPEFVAALLGMNFSDIEAFTLDIRRKVVLSRGRIALEDAATTGLERLKERLSRSRSPENFPPSDSPPSPSSIRPKSDKRRSAKISGESPSS
ncbi:MAG: AAA family ATPase [Limimaricola soesokkakensis]|uniref:AAA family ATPase n=1 Tax=Limimaricola soesokkakensis TaxID=1343159 RepID=UPI00405A3CAC